MFEKKNVYTGRRRWSGEARWGLVPGLHGLQLCRVLILQGSLHAQRHSQRPHHEGGRLLPLDVHQSTLQLSS